MQSLLELEKAGFVLKEGKTFIAKRFGQDTKDINERSQYKY